MEEIGRNIHFQQNVGGFPQRVDFPLLPDWKDGEKVLIRDLHALGVNIALYQGKHGNVQEFVAIVKRVLPDKVFITLKHAERFYSTAIDAFLASSHVLAMIGPVNPVVLGMLFALFCCYGKLCSGVQNTGYQQALAAGNLNIPRMLIDHDTLMRWVAIERLDREVARRYVTACSRLRVFDAATIADVISNNFLSLTTGTFAVMQKNIPNVKGLLTCSGIYDNEVRYTNSKNRVWLISKCCRDWAKNYNGENVRQFLGVLLKDLCHMHLTPSVVDALKFTSSNAATFGPRSSKKTVDRFLTTFDSFYCDMRSNARITGRDLENRKVSADGTTSMMRVKVVDDVFMTRDSFNVDSYVVLDRGSAEFFLLTLMREEWAEFLNVAKFVNTPSGKKTDLRYGELQQYWATGHAASLDSPFVDVIFDGKHLFCDGHLVACMDGPEFLLYSVAITAGLKMRDSRYACALRSSIVTGLTLTDMSYFLTPHIEEADGAFIADLKRRTQHKMGYRSLTGVDHLYQFGFARLLFLINQYSFQGMSVFCEKHMAPLWALASFFLMNSTQPKQSTSRQRLLRVYSIGLLKGSDRSLGGTSGHFRHQVVMRDWLDNREDVTVIYLPGSEHYRNITRFCSGYFFLPNFDMKNGCDLVTSTFVGVRLPGALPPDVKWIKSKTQSYSSLNTMLGKDHVVFNVQPPDSKCFPVRLRVNVRTNVMSHMLHDMMVLFDRIITARSAFVFRDYECSGMMISRAPVCFTE